MVRKHEVASSAVECVWHDPGRNELIIAFHRQTGTDEVYVYSNVPETKVTELLSADSIGQFVAQQIRNVYPFRKEARSEYDGAAQAAQEALPEAWREFYSGRRRDNGVRVIRLATRNRAAA